MTEYKKLYRNTDNRMIGGVCAGLADYFAIDPTIIRLIAAALLLCGVGSPVLVYIIMWIVIPERPTAA
ncbi:MAG: PspC domain-containing protein [Actinomycetes bacterium]|jgi:phage shock protein PspC (stress-responsive transcriptional regulator)|nr:PspC domain-containing protein [Actinomycetes bacterium]